jgi:hypothetical protein
MSRLDNGNKLFVPSDQQSKDCIVRVLTNIKQYSLSIIPDSRRNGKKMVETPLLYIYLSPEYCIIDVSTGCYTSQIQKSIVWIPSISQDRPTAMQNGTSWFILQSAQQNQHEIWIHSIA